ncbi:MAG: DNA alkylation repair protein [Ignavibacteriaceae bacterium]
MPYKNLKRRVKEESNPERAKFLQRFFKTGKGEYAEGDIFAGITVPIQRGIAKENLDLSFKELGELIKSPVHEERLISLLILVLRFPKAEPKEQEKIFKFYIKNIKTINNWDLVDLTAPNIAGWFLFDKDRTLLYELAISKNIWARRIAVIATFYFIKRNQYSDALSISKILLNDKHDLIHKATGWMLREIGKRNITAEEDFLKKYYKQMPRTMLRYAIEKFPEPKRKKYLMGKM